MSIREKSDWVDASPDAIAIVPDFSVGEGQTASIMPLPETDVPKFDREVKQSGSASSWVRKGGGVEE